MSDPLSQLMQRQEKRDAAEVELLRVQRITEQATLAHQATGEPVRIHVSSGLMGASVTVSIGTCDRNDATLDQEPDDDIPEAAEPLTVTPGKWVDAKPWDVTVNAELPTPDSPGGES